MASNAQGSSSVKALLVDDMLVDTLLLSTMLRHFHCETTVAKNGKEAIDMFLQGKKFDIVLLEKRISIITGPEAVEKIRAMGETDVKIVGLSVETDDQEAFTSAGADVFVPKPMKLEVLGAMVQEVTNKKKNAMVEA